MTPRCDLRCPYCYNVWNSPGGEEPTELSTKDALRLASIVAGIGPASVTLTGGEPLLRDDLEELVSALAASGIKVGVATNGRILGAARAEHLVRAGVRWFDVGLPAAGEEGYGTVTGTPGADLARKAMINAKAAGAGLNVAQVLTADSIGHTLEIIGLAAAVGADAVILNRFVPGGRGSQRSEDLSPTGADLVRTLKAAGEASMRLGIPVCLGIPVEDCLHPHECLPGISPGSCACGEWKWAVGPDGTLRHCEQSPHVLGSLLETPFHLLTSGPEVEDFRKDDLTGSCRSCGSYATCGGGCRFLRPGGP